MTTSITRAPAQRGTAPVWANTALLAAEWGCVLAAAGLWASERPPQGVLLLGAPLWVAGWVWRWLRLGQPTRATALDWPLLAFVLTALVGLWAGPSRADGLARLDLFLGAIGIYYLLANSPKNSRDVFALGLAILAALLALYFASQHDWSASPAKFAIIGQVGLLLNRHLPRLKLYQPNANVVANLLVLALPAPILQASTGLAGWRGASRRRRLAALLAGTCALVIVAGLVMSESRASALALGGAAGLAAWWWATGQIAQRFGQGRLAVFLGGVAAIALAGVAVALAAPSVITLALGSLPGPNSVISRTELFAQAWRLAQDTPFTGGGLAAFPGLYATYMLGVPNLYLTHAHNAYLNVLVEQGWPGLLSFVAVLAAALVAGARRWHEQKLGRQDALIGAGLLGLAVISLQGLGDGTLLASRVALAWLIPAGLAIGGLSGGVSSLPNAALDKKAGATVGRRRAWLPWAVVGIAAVGFLAWVSWRGWLSAWYANIGEVAFARIQLEGWPTNQWSNGQEALRLATIEPVFERALALNPANETALYRLGLLAGLRRDYAGAVQNLASAHLTDPGHRGIVKALAYAYVWTGDLPDARPLLKLVPEAANEMVVYNWWWGTQGRPDLAQRAHAAADELANSP